MSDYQATDFEQQEFDERVIEIARVAKVVKGGRRFSFRVAVVVGDEQHEMRAGLGGLRASAESDGRQGKQIAAADHRLLLFH